MGCPEKRSTTVPDNVAVPTVGGVGAVGRRLVSHALEDTVKQSTTTGINIKRDFTVRIWAPEFNPAGHVPTCSIDISDLGAESPAASYTRYAAPGRSLWGACTCSPNADTRRAGNEAHRSRR